MPPKEKSGHEGAQRKPLPASRASLVGQRANILFLLVLLGFLVIMARSAYLQLYQHQRYKKLAALQQSHTVSLAGKRGLITDRNGHKLALDIKAYSVYMDPKYIKDDPQSIAEQLAIPLEEEPSDLLALIKGNNWRYLKRKVSPETAQMIRELKIKGIGLISENKRVYPHNKMAASLLGYTDIDNRGREGIEKSFNEYLEGGQKQVRILTDAYGNELLRTDGNLPFLTEKSKANTVVLTIDENIQYIVERELEKGMQQTKSERGVAMVMDTQNGDLLALATNPSIDLNSILANGWDPKIKNWAVTDFYEPGSTMKIFTIAAALETGKTHVDEVIQTPTLIYVDKWPVHDHGQPPGKIRPMKPFKMLEVSSNVGCSILGRRMTPEVHRSLLLKFGYGQKTESRLSGEVKGLMPALPWAASTQSTISFGQGIAVTPLQVLTATSAIANNGVRVEPRIIQRIVSPDQKIIKAFPPVKTRTLSEKTADELLEMMKQVVESKGGTAHNAKIPGYVLGGKTGTADKVVGGRYNGDVMSSFVGVLPLDNPRYVIFVLMDAPKTAHYATLTAVPVFKEIVKHMITYYGIQPSLPEELEAHSVSAL